MRPPPQREGLAHRAHPLGFAREILRGLGVESGLCGVDYELAEHPFVYLILRALLGLAERDAQGLQLGLVERVGQIVEQVLRSASSRLA